MSVLSVMLLDAFNSTGGTSVSSYFIIFYKCLTFIPFVELNHVMLQKKQCRVSCFLFAQSVCRVMKTAHYCYALWAEGTSSSRLQRAKIELRTKLRTGLTLLS